MVVKRIGPMSMAKVQGALGVLIGLLLGICFAAFASLGSAFVSEASDGTSLGMVSAIFGVGAIIILPILSGIFGFIGGLIGAVLYNWVAGMVGGLEIETS